MPGTADQNGHVEGEFTIPEGVPAGTKLVEFEGDQGSYGQTTYTSRGLITTEERQTVIVQSNTDPLAQTFTLKESRFLAGVDVWFVAKGTSRIVCQIRETNLGMPTQTVLAEGHISASQISLTDATRITFPPIWCVADTEYAFVLLTDDAEHTVALAELGKYDSVHGTWVTAQPYQIGVLLSSSNASTWTAHQDKDLAFRLLAAKFTENQSTVVLENAMTASNLTDILVLGNVERPTSQTDVDFSLTEANGTTHKLSEDLPLALREKVSGNLVFRAHLKGTQTYSPVLFPGLQAVLGTVSETADYVTRSIPTPDATKVTVTYEAMTPGTSAVKIYIQNGNDWELVALSSGTPVDSNWVERTHILENFTQNSTRIKIVLEGTVLYRPKVRSLRVIAT
jgi:hypothetical protein